MYKFCTFVKFILTYFYYFWCFRQCNCFFFFFFLFFFFFFCFLVLYLQHMEVPRLGVELELQPPAYTQPQQLETRAVSATYTTTHCNARSLTHWPMPGIEPASSWMLVRFVSHWATMETPIFLISFSDCSLEAYQNTFHFYIYFLPPFWTLL